jgi:hypothetical protein
VSWNQLTDIFERNRDEHRQWCNDPPTACPHDGEPLSVGPDNELFCVSDGWTWDGTPEGKRGCA